MAKPTQTKDRTTFSNVPKGQGGRSIGAMLAKTGSGGGSNSERRGLRAKNQYKPMGKRKYHNGCHKYVPMGVNLTPDGKPIGWDGKWATQ